MTTRPRKEWVRTILTLHLVSIVVIAAGTSTLAAPREVLGHQKISDTEGLFTGTLDNADEFGFSTAELGDVNGDGVRDLAVGARGDDDGGLNRGAVWILFLDTDGTVKGHQKISDTEGNFSGTLDNADQFGQSVEALGDLDGDGVVDLAVGPRGDDDGGTDRGAVWILFLNSNGTVKTHQKISALEGNFTGLLDNRDYFGHTLAWLGDLDGDGVGDLAAGALGDDDGGLARGAVWILFLNTDGTVKGHQKISDTEGNFSGALDNFDWFAGMGLSAIGDLDGDGAADLAVGAVGDDDGGSDRGAVWVLFLDHDGTVKAHQKISDTEGGFSGVLDDVDYFGQSVTYPGDLDGDAIGDLVVGAPGDDDGGPDRGAAWALFLDTDGTVKEHQKISSTSGEFTGVLDDADAFGAPAALGDIDGDGRGDLAVGAPGDDDGGGNRGAVWVLFLDTDPYVPVGAGTADGLVIDKATGRGRTMMAPGDVLRHQKISDIAGDFTGVLDDGDEFGFSTAELGDLDGDYIKDLAVGARGDDDGGPDRGAVWILFLNFDGTVKTHQKISDTEGNFTGTLDDGDQFGQSIEVLGDLDGDGVVDLAVGPRGDDDGGPDYGAVWILFLNSDGTVKTHQKISDTEGNFTGILENRDYFGHTLAWLGDLDGDGVGDLAVGAQGDDDGGESHGAIWILFLYTDGTVKAHQKISDTAGNFTATLDDFDWFAGQGLSAIGDVDRDGVVDLAAGATGDDDGGPDRGAVFVLFLNPDGTVKRHQKISDTEGGFTGVLDDSDFFGQSVTYPGDLDGDGFEDLAAGAPGDDDGGVDRGAVWVLFLDDNGMVTSHRKISATAGGFTGHLDNFDNFAAPAALGDLDWDGRGDLAVGALNDDDGGPARGAVWVLFLDAVVQCSDCEPITLSWNPSCDATDDDYAIYQGILKHYTSHRPVTCSTDRETTWTFEPRPGPAYLLVVPQKDREEGSYGQSTDSVERPQGPEFCADQYFVTCP